MSGCVGTGDAVFLGMSAALYARIGVAIASNVVISASSQNFMASARPYRPSSSFLWLLVEVRHALTACHVTGG